MKTVTKIFAIAAFCASVVSCSSCGTNKNARKEIPTVKSEAELQQEALIKIHLDSLSNDFIKLQPVGIVNSVKDGKVELSEKELQLKPDYLVDPAYANRGIGAVVSAALLRMLREDGIEYAETNLNLETNYDIQNMWKRFKAVQHKRRRAYVKSLTEAEQHD